MTALPNLNGFDDVAIEYVREALELGWRAQRSRKNHIRLMAPDGCTTTAIPRDMSARHARANYYRPIKRWKEAMVTVTTANGVEVYTCDVKDCLYETTNPPALTMHRIAVHSKPKPCPYPDCDLVLQSPSGYSRHVNRHIREAEAEAEAKAAAAAAEAEAEAIADGKTLSEIVDEAEAKAKAKAKAKAEAEAEAEAAAEPEAPVETAAAPSTNGRAEITSMIDPSELPIDQLLTRVINAVPYINDLVRRVEDHQTMMTMMNQTWGGKRK